MSSPAARPARRHVRVERRRIAQRIGEPGMWISTSRPQRHGRSPSRPGDRAPGAGCGGCRSPPGSRPGPGLGAQPARARRPRQEAKAGRAWQETRLLAKPKPATRSRRARHAVGGAVGGVPEEDRAHHADAVVQRPRHGGGGERLAAQHAVGVAPADADESMSSPPMPPAAPLRKRRRGWRRLRRGFGEAHRRLGSSRRALEYLAAASQAAPARFAAAPWLPCASQPVAGAM